MITQTIREHDGDCLISETPDVDEIICECGKIVRKEDAGDCAICNRCVKFYNNMFS
jgi:hypothetical protein